MAQDKVVEMQRDIKTKAEDYREFLDDLKSWEEDIKKKDAAAGKKNKIEADYPPVRGTVDEASVLKRAAEKEKEDPIMRQKDLGNEFFKKGKFEEAVKHYAKGISFDPDDKNAYLLYANKAMALLKLERWSEAEEDATRCVQSNRTYVKGFFRRALARRGADKTKEAVADLQTVLVLEPSNKEASTLLAQLQAVLKKQQKTENVQNYPTAQRKKLQIEEVDEDEDDEDDIEVPITKQNPAPAAVPVSTPTPVSTKVPDKSDVEVLDDDEEPPRSKHADPNASSGRKGKVFAPRAAALNAVEEYKKSDDREVPETYLQFERVWKAFKGDLAMKGDYLSRVPREKFQDFFCSNITEDVLGDVISVMHDVYVPAGTPDAMRRSYDIVKCLTQLDRLSALLLFLDDDVSKKLAALPSLLQNVPGADFSKLAAALKKKMDA